MRIENRKKYIAVLMTIRKNNHAIIAQYSSADNPLMILCDPTRKPYSYIEDGEMKGILPDYFRKLADYCGISYQFILCDSREDAMEAVKAEMLMWHLCTITQHRNL